MTPAHRLLLIAPQSGPTLSQGLGHLLPALAALGCTTLLLTGPYSEKVAPAACRLPGVAELWLETSPQPHNSETLAPWLADIITRHGFSHGVAAADTWGRDVMPRLAAMLDRPMLSEGIAILDGETFQRPLLTGRAVETVRFACSPILLTLRPGAFAAHQEENHLPPPTRQLPSPTPVEGRRPLAFLPTPTGRVELSVADVVVAGGQGVGEAEHFQWIEALAQRLGGAVGASRGAVDAGFAPNDWQIGQTGKIIAPDLYMAIGISGAIQHLAGLQSVQTLVAINRDAEAPIFAVSDYGLVADLRQALPQLLELLPKEG